eukprot:COSAG06_NODE_682_length_13115_cov_17.917793_6_plen_66_part_00
MHERQCDGRVRVACYLGNEPAGCVVAETNVAHHLIQAVLARVSMSEAVEGAELMLYGVSEKYKER